MADLPLVSPLDRALFLAAQPYFAGLDASIVATLATYTEERFARPGEWIHHEGDALERVSFLAEGRVSLMCGDQMLREISSPAGVGVAPALSGSRWAPGIVATEPTVYLSLPREDLMQILEDRFPLFLQMARTLSRQPGEPVVFGNRPPRLPETLDLVGRVVAARRNSLFAEINLTVLIELLRTAEEIHLSAGERIWDSGIEGRGLIVPVEGTLFVHDRKCPAKAGPGDLIGLTELFAEQSDTIALEASVDSRLLQISKTTTIDVIEDHFEVARRFLQHLAMRFMDSW